MLTATAVFLWSTSRIAASSQSLGFSYELDTPNDGVKYRGNVSPMKNVFLPIVRVSRMFQVALKNKMFLFRYTYFQAATNRMMNMFRRKRKRKDVLVINRKSIPRHKTVLKHEKGKKQKKQARKAHSSAFSSKGIKGHRRASKGIKYIKD